MSATKCNSHGSTTWYQLFGTLKKHWSNVCHRYMYENPGKVATKFQFSLLLHKAWFQLVQPETIRSGFWKVKIYPFSAKAIKPLTLSQVTESEEEHSSSDTATQEPGDKLNQSVCSSSGISLKDSSISFTIDQVSLFQQRYDNGYNLYHDKMYV